MKKFIILAIITLFVTSCDDGIIKVENLNFTEATTETCGNLVYKLNDSEALLISLPELVYNEAFANAPTEIGLPTTIQINASNQVLYRFYNGPVTSNTICSAIPPLNPQPQEEWIGISGSMQVTTTPVLTPNDDFPGGQNVTAYKHQITFKNITFEKPGGNQFYDTFVFGVFQKAVTPISFVFDESLDKCPNSNLIYNIAGSSAFTLKIDPNLIKNEVTILDQPRIGYISTINVLEYKKFGSIVPNSYFCGATIPTTPAVLETYSAIPGVEDVSGIIEVTTTTNGAGFLHDIHLKKVTLKSTLGVTFLLANDYSYGQLITN